MHDGKCLAVTELAHVKELVEEVKVDIQHI